MTVLARDDNVQIEGLQLGPYGTNAYIVLCRKTQESVLIDAPAEASTIIERLAGTNPQYILLTHNHMDHLGALAELQSRLKVPVAVHAFDARNLPAPPERLLNDEDAIAFGNIKLRVIHTPGHTPGSLCFHLGRYLIAGDTIFPGGPGKTRSPADLKQIIKSITEKILVLPADTEIYPGHGETTLVKKAQEEYAVFASHPHDPNLCGDVLWLSP